MSKVFEAIVEQIREEIASSYLYMAMSADMESKGFTGTARWFAAQAMEEMGHAMKFYRYLVERGHKVTFATIEAPPSTWEDLKAAFDATLAHEKHITERTHKLYRLAQQANDPATEVMLHWFIKEQVEEEAAVNDILAKIEMLGKTPHAMFLLDRELGSRPMPSSH